MSFTRRDSIKFLTAASIISSTGIFRNNALAAKPKSIAGLFDGPVTDKNWAQMGYEGLKRAEAEGAKIVYTDRLTIDRYVEVMRNYARRGYDRIVGHSGGFMEAALQVGAEFPDQKIVVIAGAQSNKKNVTSYIFDGFELGYLAGVLAGQMTKTKKVAQVNGVDVPVSNWMTAGIAKGIEDTAPEVTFRKIATGSWTDVNKSREAAISLIEWGADVIVPSGGGQLDMGTIASAEDKEIMVIGNMMDTSSLAPNGTLSGVQVNVPDLFYTGATTELDGEVHLLGIREDMVQMRPYSDRVPGPVREKVASIIEDFRNNKIQRISLDKM
jgi:basic membrane lipoprotein Med (substrate-binding protein (PBP1-ABC) superfamily)